jgi:hypothetical protein
MVVYSCKKCGEAKCEKCETINTITLEKGVLKNKNSFIIGSLIALIVIIGL